MQPRNEAEQAQHDERNEPPPKPRRIEEGSLKDLLRVLEVWHREEPDVRALMEEMRKKEYTATFDRGREVDGMELPAADVIDAYVEWKNENDCLDYHDLIALGVQLLEAEPDCAPEVGYVLADEYQDTDPLQERWLEALRRARQAPLYAVGDAHQGIYHWRGAAPRQITELAGRIGATALHLTINFRSPPEVLEVANAALARNRVRVEGQTLRPAEGLWDGVARRTVKVRGFRTARDESLWITRHVGRFIEGGDRPRRSRSCRASASCGGSWRWTSAGPGSRTG